MKKFSEYNILPKGNFVGDKIKITKILNNEVELHDFKIVESKFKKDEHPTSCLYLQIRYNGDLLVVFTGSKNLIEMVSQVPKEDLPILITIVKNGDRLEFR